MVGLVQNKKEENVKHNFQTQQERDHSNFELIVVSSRVFEAAVHNFPQCPNREIFTGLTTWPGIPVSNKPREGTNDDSNKMYACTVKLHYEDNHHALHKCIDRLSESIGFNALDYVFSSIM